MSVQQVNRKMIMDCACLHVTIQFITKIDLFVLALLV